MVALVLFVRGQGATPFLEVLENNRQQGNILHMFKSFQGYGHLKLIDTWLRVPRSFGYVTLSLSLKSQWLAQEHLGPSPGGCLLASRWILFARSAGLGLPRAALREWAFLSPCCWPCLASFVAVAAVALRCWRSCQAPFAELCVGLEQPAPRL